MGRPYTLKAAKIGCEVFGIDLARPVSNEVKDMLRSDVTKHRILIFRQQGDIAPERHLEIGRWFGTIESTFYDHPKSPLRDIFRVSNDRNEGCTNVGRTGWHIDGSFQEAPFSHSLYHIIATPIKGTTSFVPLREVIEGLGDERRKYWERIWMVSDRRSGPLHPLIYKHPETKDPTLCFHLGMTEGFILDLGSPNQRPCSQAETEDILSQIKEEIVGNPDRLYHHFYEKGDFLITDNLAVGHEASPDTQLPRSEVGLRVMHRVTIAGKYPPSK